MQSFKVSNCLKICDSSHLFWERNRRVDYPRAIPAGVKRREILKISVLVPILIETNHKNANAKFEEMPALQGKDYGKSRTQYPDFVQLDSGLQFKDLKTGDGQSASNGKEVVVDWSGVTLGYYGRPFEARNKPVGGAFVGDTKDFFRFTVGDENIIPAFNEAVSTMKVGGIRRIIVPPEIGYPAGNFKKFGPKPTTFSGERTLDFVLKNRGMIDKTLLFDIELIKVKE